ncbi:hypothetical protein E3P99_00047 [Wallemia hederae]|uniref:Actin-related protein 2/3 complex subunit 5 n=1 Tax=Wallemia hederae TaxID=1540922 RepID=A0A4T0FXZ9_9BASI|nr:hypothetical protein E3P99_00047 [Wallemia hederae]
MPVPFEALIPVGLITVMFGVVSVGMNSVKFARNDMKPTRYNLDQFDQIMMRRDERLTGSNRGQQANPTAPKEFATNSVWQTEEVILPSELNFVLFFQLAISVHLTLYHLFKLLHAQFTLCFEIQRTVFCTSLPTFILTMMMTNFRSIDIDAIQDEYYKDEELLEVDARDPNELANHFNSLSSQSRSLINGNQIAQALALHLDAPPYGPTQSQAKDINTNAIIQIVSSTRTADISAIVAQLQPHHQDNLMKYIYKLMATKLAESQGNVFLSWHEKLTQLAGTGSIAVSIASVVCIYIGGQCSISFFSTLCFFIMLLTKSLAALALLSPALAWQDKQGDVPSGSLSLIINSALVEEDSYQGWDNSIYTTCATEKRSHDFVIRGNQCFDAVGLPIQPDLANPPYVNIGLDFCRNLGENPGGITVTFKGEEIDVDSDDRCNSIPLTDNGKNVPAFRCILAL